MLKVIKNEYINNDPNDLMTITELCDKWNFKKGYLYSISCGKHEINIYLRGTIKLSEKEVLEHEENKRKMKYGGCK